MKFSGMLTTSHIINGKIRFTEKLQRSKIRVRNKSNGKRPPTHNRHKAKSLSKKLKKSRREQELQVTYTECDVIYVGYINKLIHTRVLEHLQKKRKKYQNQHIRPGVARYIVEADHMLV